MAIPIKLDVASISPKATAPLGHHPHQLPVFSSPTVILLGIEVSPATAVVKVLLEVFKSAAYSIQTVSELAKRDQIELFFLLNGSVLVRQGVWGKIKSNIKTKGLLRTVELVFFKLITAIGLQDLRTEKAVSLARFPATISPFFKNKNPNCQH